MEFFLDSLKHPFTWGLLAGLFFFLLCFWHFLQARSELNRFKKLLSDKLELESRHHESLRKEKEGLARENENLRLRVSQLAEKPDQRILRDLEVLARAEKKMNLRAPGFAGAWETAKTEAFEEISAEDQGKSLPRRLFTKLFGQGSVRDAEAKVLSDGSQSSFEAGERGGKS